MSGRSEAIEVIIKKSKTRDIQKKNKFNLNWILGGVIPLILFVSWEIAGRFGFIEAHLLPTPSKIIKEIIEMGASGALWEHIGTTLFRVALGFFLGTIAALILGSTVGYFSVIEKLLDPLIQAFRSIPSLAWVPLFILWMGIGEPSKVTLIAVGVFFPV